MTVRAAGIDTAAGRVRTRTAIPVAGYLFYVGVVWFAPISTPNAAPADAAPQMQLAESLAAWRTARCQTCHSIHGLGGHNGPDLTNVVSRRSAAYVRAMMLVGPPGMPSYRELSPATADGVVEYLTAVDRTAQFPSRTWRGSNAVGAR